MRKNGFSLAELLITLAVSSIIIGAAFGSYMVISRNYNVQSDLKYISQTARVVVDMIQKDVRMAGYKDDLSTSIANPVILSNSGTADCCDAISVVYDKSATVRHQTTYYTNVYPDNSPATDRYRLYKQVCQITPGNPYTIENIIAGNCANVVQAEAAIADYVQDLQFVGTRSSCESGVIKAGCGTRKIVKPTIIQQPSDLAWCCSMPDCGGDISKLQDGDWGSPWTCDLPTMGHVLFTANFSNPVRLLNFTWGNAAHIDGGSLGSSMAHPYTTAQYPYATANPIRHNMIVQLNKSDAQCATDTCSLSDFVSNRINTYGKCEGPSDNAISDPCQYSFEPFNASGGATELGGNAADKLANFAFNRIYFAYHDGDALFCSYTAAGQLCNPVWGNNVNPPGHRNRRSLSEVIFFVEEFGEILPQEIEIGLLIRSPNEHGSVDRSINSPLTLGDREVSWNDKYLRDFYSTSSVMRNVFYQSQ